MICRLSERIWWGDQHCLLETTDAKCILNVSQNQYDYYWQRLGAYSQKTPYFRLPKYDEETADSQYIQNIDSILDMAERNNWYPLLIHCLAGCHRSMTVAAYAQWRLNGRTGIDDIMAKIRSLLLNPNETGNFHKTFMAHIRAAS